MSLNHATIATSLPSFAQTFGSQSLSASALSSNNALPPIQSRKDSMIRSNSRPTSTELASRKRSHDDVSSSAHSSPDSCHSSPRLTKIKEENEHSPPSNSIPVQVPSSPGELPSPLKKRRVTVSGTAPTLLRPPPDQTPPNPISPVVKAFPINSAPQSDQARTNPVKQKQKPMLDQHQHRSNGISDDRLSATTPSKPSVAPPPRSLRRSPNPLSSIRGRNPNVTSSGTRPPSPNPIIQQPLSIAARASFTRRRAAQLGPGKKPADLLISPRDANAPDQRPLIQSAPPIPDRGQSAYYTDILPIALPRIPSLLNSADNVRRVASNVPPTPTRLSMQQRPPPSAIQPAIPTPQPVISGRSPPAASIPIATTLVPPTPSSLHHPGYTGDKAAFLAPFGMFYDALSDSKELKKWLSEQLQKSNSLMQTLAQQQDKMADIVETLVERKVAGMRSEMTKLQRRVEELDEALRQSKRAEWDKHHRNGTGEPHTYPSAEPLRSKLDSVRTGPSWAQEREEAGDTDVGSRTSHPSDPPYARPSSQANHHLHPPNSSRATGRSPGLTNLTVGDNASPRTS